ncbi:MAG: hypothetical protein ACKE9I_05215 [Methylophagaceae bacterium]
MPYLKINNRFPAFITIVFIMLSLLTACDALREERAMDIWKDRINKPQLGDFYGVNQFTLNGEEAPDDNQFEIYKVVAFNSSTITFIESAHLYNFYAVNDLIDTGEVTKIKMWTNNEEQFSYSKEELIPLLNSHVIGGVFRLD